MANELQDLFVLHFDLLRNETKKTSWCCTNSDPDVVSFQQTRRTFFSRNGICNMICILPLLPIKYFVAIAVDHVADGHLESSAAPLKRNNTFQDADCKRAQSYCNRFALAVHLCAALNWDNLWRPKIRIVSKSCEPPSFPV